MCNRKQNINRFCWGSSSGRRHGRRRWIGMALAVLLLLSGCGAENTVAQSGTADLVASEDERAPQQAVGEDAGEALAAEDVADGVYTIAVDSSSSMFRIVACTLTVEEHAMRAAMTLSGTGYLRLYMGSGAEAALADEAEYCEFYEDAEGRYVYDVPVEALNRALPCAGFSKRKEKWYDHEVAFLADTMQPAGETAADGAGTGADTAHTGDGIVYADVTLTGGAGKASIASPAQITVRDGRMIARIAWSSANYDYMLVDGEKYLPVNEDGNSVFEIPVTLGATMTVVADTTAMSTPHEIEYTLEFTPTTDGETEEEQEETSLSQAMREVDFGDPPPLLGHALLSTVTPAYATGFRIWQYEGGVQMIATRSGRTYLLLPENTEADIPADGAIVLQKPLDRIYLAASSAMALFLAAEADDHIRFSALDADSWTLDAARRKLESGAVVYAGKYSRPDYERLLSEGCDLAIESTMILHTPAVQEKLKELGIPVFIDESSYEQHPLGRTEWVRVYGALTDTEENADRLMREQEKILKTVEQGESTGETVAFFFINAAGSAVVRRGGDYIARMIGMAGGDYLFVGDAAGTGSQTLTMEQFYDMARDADYLIYNATIDAPLSSVEELTGKSEILSAFRAVRNGNVYTTDRSLYQATDRAAAFVADVQAMLAGETGAMTFLRSVE